VCAALEPVETRLAVHVLIHRLERGKPSSTGMLVGRTVRGARCHTYQRVSRYFPAMGLPPAALEPDRELWILHPAGESLPRAPAAGGESGGPGIQVLLLDGTWRQAGDILRTVEGVGRCVRLPESAAALSRYWLRDQPAPGHLSTAEALVSVLTAVGEPEAARRLRLHFELHVFATLLSRGKREMAERYLGHSPLLAEVPGTVDRLLDGAGPVQTAARPDSSA